MIPTAHPSPQPKRHPYRFSRLCTDDRWVSLYFIMVRPFSPKNLPLPMGGSGPPSNTWFPGPTQVLNRNGSSIGAAVFAVQGSLVWQTDRPTDHATPSVRIGRIYVRSTVMRPNNTIIYTATCGIGCRHADSGRDGLTKCEEILIKSCNSWCFQCILLV